MLASFFWTSAWGRRRESFRRTLSCGHVHCGLRRTTFGIVGLARDTGFLFRARDCISPHTRTKGTHSLHATQCDGQFVLVLCGVFQKFPKRFHGSIRIGPTRWNTLSVALQVSTASRLFMHVRGTTVNHKFGSFLWSLWLDPCSYNFATSATACLNSPQIKARRASWQQTRTCWAASLTCWYHSAGFRHWSSFSTGRVVSAGLPPLDGHYRRKASVIVAEPASCLDRSKSGNFC